MVSLNDLTGNTAINADLDCIQVRVNCPYCDKPMPIIVTVKTLLDDQVWHVHYICQHQECGREFSVDMDMIRRLCQLLGQIPIPERQRPAIIIKDERKAKRGL